jgi:hypothetical protein
MADNITSQTTLKAEYLELETEVDRLVDDSGDLSVDPVPLHTAAWSAVKRDLAQRVPSVTEDDLTSTDSLQHPTHLWVMSRLYSLSGHDDDKVRAAHYWSRYKAEMRLVKLDVGGTQAASGSQTLMVRR